MSVSVGVWRRVVRVSTRSCECIDVQIILVASGLVLALRLYSKGGHASPQRRAAGCVQSVLVARGLILVRFILWCFRCLAAHVDAANRGLVHTFVCIEDHSASQFLLTSAAGKLCVSSMPCSERTCFTLFR